MKRIFLMGLAGLAMCLLLTSAEDAQAENCPLDWHPPPCGNPPIRQWDKEVAKALQQPLENTRIVMIAWGVTSCPFTFVSRDTVPAGLDCAGSVIGARRRGNCYLVFKKVYQQTRGIGYLSMPMTGVGAPFDLGLTGMLGINAYTDKVLRGHVRDIGLPW